MKSKVKEMSIFNPIGKDVCSKEQKERCKEKRTCIYWEEFQLYKLAQRTFKECNNN